MPVAAYIALVLQLFQRVASSILVFVVYASSASNNRCCVKGLLVNNDNLTAINVLEETS